MSCGLLTCSCCVVCVCGFEFAIDVCLFMSIWFVLTMFDRSMSNVVPAAFDQPCMQVLFIIEMWLL